jgi:cardiolipin synthase
MNLPNLLSSFRLFVTVFFIALVVHEQYRLALLLFILQALSDLFDGFLARRMGSKTNLGAYLDPLADKVMLAASYLVLAYQAIVPFWLVAIVLSRDIIITLGFLFLSRRAVILGPVPTLFSKATTLFQMLTVVYVLWSEGRGLDMVFFYATAFFTAGSGIQYVLSGCTALYKKEIV